jgi:outer membrane immunogenic protein
VAIVVNIPSGASNSKLGFRRIKKLLAGTVALNTLAAPASAVDPAARPYFKAPPAVIPIYDWSGFYVGSAGTWSTPAAWSSLRPLAWGAIMRREARWAVTSATAGK